MVSNFKAGWPDTNTLSLEDENLVHKLHRIVFVCGWYSSQSLFFPPFHLHDSLNFLTSKGLSESAFFFAFVSDFGFLAGGPVYPERNFSMLDHTCFKSRRYIVATHAQGGLRARCVELKIARYSKLTIGVWERKKSGLGTAVRTSFVCGQIGAVARWSGLPKLSQRSLVDCLPRFFYSRQAGDWHRTINTPNFQSSRHWRVGDR